MGAWNWLHIPLPELDEALKLSNEDFEEKYNYPKFNLSDQIMIHCRSGGRAGDARDIMEAVGYTNVEHYPCYWDDWKNLFSISPY